jgi:NAD(P)-dependent dehydrogenase (short-subunit alcohol dehydrogenase family)
MGRAAEARPGAFLAIAEILHTYVCQWCYSDPLDVSVDDWRAAPAGTTAPELVGAMTYPLTNKVVLITGATSGIGMATATALHARGANVVLTGRRQEVLDELALKLGERALAMTADVTDRQAIDAVVTAAADRFGGLDIVIANAGISVEVPTTIAAVDEQEFERVIDVDLLGAWRTVRAALPQVIARRGHVVVTASVYAFANGAASAAYAMSKAALEQFGRALRAELAPHGATAGVLYPGWTTTPLANPVFGGNAVATELFRRGWPAPLRAPITAERVAAATVRGIERRSARIIVPNRWIFFSVLRGIVNPLVDHRIERNPKIRELVLELEHDTARRDHVPHR